MPPPARCSSLFWWDFLFMFPFAPVILTINPGYYDSTTGLYIGLLGFLKLVRAV